MLQGTVPHFCLSKSSKGTTQRKKKTTASCNDRQGKDSKKWETQLTLVRPSCTWSCQLESTPGVARAACWSLGPGPQADWVRQRCYRPPLGASVYSLDCTGGVCSWHWAHIFQLVFTEPHPKCCIPGLKTANVRGKSSVEKTNTFCRKKKEEEEEKKKNYALIASRQVWDGIDLHFQSLRGKRHLPERWSFRKRWFEGSRIEGIQHGLSFKEKALQAGSLYGSNAQHGDCS